jgi:pilus assembly protein Flp/PilA
LRFDISEPWEMRALCLDYRGGRFCGREPLDPLTQAAGGGSLRRIFIKLLQDELGVTAIEYALIAALIAVAAIAAFTLVGTNLSTTFSYLASQL